jgi:hypothetical protein
MATASPIRRAVAGDLENVADILSAASENDPFWCGCFRTPSLDDDASGRSSCSSYRVLMRIGTATSLTKEPPSGSPRAPGRCQAGKSCKPSPASRGRLAALFPERCTAVPSSTSITPRSLCTGIWKRWAWLPATRAVESGPGSSNLCSNAATLRDGLPILRPPMREAWRFTSGLDSGSARSSANAVARADPEARASGPCGGNQRVACDFLATSDPAKAPAGIWPTASPTVGH